MAHLKLLRLVLLTGCLSWPFGSLTLGLSAIPQYSDHTVYLSELDNHFQDELKNTGEIRGTIFGIYGEPLVGAFVRVNVIGYPPQTVASMVTDSEGQYSLRVPPGLYAVYVSYANNRITFKSRTRTPFFVTSNTHLIRNIDLRSGFGLIITSSRHKNSLTSKAFLPAQQIDIVFDYRIQAPFFMRFGDHHIVVGIEDVPQQRHIVGTPGTYPGVSGTVECSITTPERAGNYMVYIARTDESDTSQESLFQEYIRTLALEDKYHISLGEITVLDASASIYGVISSDEGEQASNMHITAVRMNSEGWSVSAVSDSSGYYHLEVPAGTYSLDVQNVEGLSWSSIRVDTMLSLEENETAVCDIVLNANRSLSFHSVSPLHPEIPVEIQPGERLLLQTAFTSRKSLQDSPGNNMIVVGVGSQACDTHVIQYSDREDEYSGINSFTVLAPQEPGDFPIYAILTRAETTTLAISDYESSLAQIPYRYIRLGILRVMQP